MNNSSTYEKIVKVKCKGNQTAKLISAIMGYVLFFSLWVAAALSSPAIFVPIITAGGLSTALVVMVSAKYLMIEYEYSFWYEQLTVSKIYGKKNRRTLIETEIKNLLMIAPATDEYVAKAKHFEPEKEISAISSDDAENVWLAVSGGKDERKVLILFEADDRSLGMLRSANPIAFIRKI